MTSSTKKALIQILVIAVAFIVAAAIAGVLSVSSTAPSSKPLCVTLKGQEFVGKDNKTTFTIPSGNAPLHFETNVKPDLVKIIRNEASADVMSSFEGTDGPVVHYYSEMTDLTQFFEIEIKTDRFDVTFPSVLAQSGQKGNMLLRSLIAKHFAPSKLLAVGQIDQSEAYYALIVTTRQSEVRIDFAVN